MKGGGSMTQRLVCGLLAGVTLAVAGCGAAPAETSEANAQVQAQIVYTLNLSETHKIDFYEYGAGLTGTHETFPVGELEALRLPDDQPRTLSELFALVRPDAETPSALKLADERAADARIQLEEKLALDPELFSRVAQSEAIDASDTQLEDGRVLRKTSAAAITCSGDFFGDQWGAAWYIQNFGTGFSNGARCPSGAGNVASFSAQGSITNAFQSTVRHSSGRILQWKQMEGDFTNPGSSSGRIVRPGTNITNFNLWSDSIPVRTISIRTMNPFTFGNLEWLVTGTSPCSHLHRTIVWCDRS